MEQDFYELFIEISKQIELIASSLQKLSRCVCDPGEILIGPEDLLDNKEGGF